MSEQFDQRLCRNLAELNNIEIETINYVLKNRYLSGFVYTYIGEILLAINPYQDPGIYTEEELSQYSLAVEQIHYPPHIYYISKVTYTNLIINGNNQCCVISGESGAGKTETCKLIVNSLSYYATKTHNETVYSLQEQCDKLNPLIEAFGNASTLMNANSSRFGKYLELQFDNTGGLLGAKLTEYLLEKTRVVSHVEGEKNFHIFYLLYAGLTQEYQNHLKMNLTSNHKYLVCGTIDKQILVNSENIREWRNQFETMVECLKTLSFNYEEQILIFSVIILVLYIGDLEFCDDDEEYAYIEDSELIIRLAGILGVNSKHLTDVFTTIATTIKDKATVFRKCSVEKAQELRDSTAKIIYSRLFSWLISRINSVLSNGKATDRVISILDIFGFENFCVNYFEQLCINTANEKLQFYFNRHIFAWEKEEYIKEGVPINTITCNNNEDICELLLQQGGLFSLLDDECNFPKGTNYTFLENLKNKFSKNSKFRMGPRNNNSFIILHYAGQIEYNVKCILEKNRDKISDNILQLLSQSEHLLIRTLFPGSQKKSNETHQLKQVYRFSKRKESFAKSFRDKQRNRKTIISSQLKPEGPVNTNSRKTIGFVFRKSLSELISNMVSCEPHFVRCIKPNGNGHPNEYDEKLVSRQLLTTGVVETVMIRKQGYPYRIAHATFVDRYGQLSFTNKASVENKRYCCEYILVRHRLSNWCIGKNKVFLRYYHVDKLNHLVEDQMKSTITLQACIRGHNVRKWTRNLLKIMRENTIAVETFLSNIEVGAKKVLSLVNYSNSKDYLRNQSNILEQDNTIKGFLSNIKVCAVKVSSVLTNLYSEDCIRNQNIVLEYEKTIKALLTEIEESNWKNVSKVKNLSLKDKSLNLIEINTLVPNNQILTQTNDENLISIIEPTSKNTEFNINDTNLEDQVKFETRPTSPQANSVNSIVVNSEKAGLAPGMYLDFNGNIQSWLKLKISANDVLVSEHLISDTRVHIRVHNDCLKIGDSNHTIYDPNILNAISCIDFGIILIRDMYCNVWIERVTKNRIYIHKIKESPFIYSQVGEKTLLPMATVKLVSFQTFLTHLASKITLTNNTRELNLEDIATIVSFYSEDKLYELTIEISFLEYIDYYNEKMANSLFNRLSYKARELSVQSLCSKQDEISINSPNLGEINEIQRINSGSRKIRKSSSHLKRDSLFTASFSQENLNIASEKEKSVLRVKSSPLHVNLGNIDDGSQEGAFVPIQELSIANSYLKRDAKTLDRNQSTDTIAIPIITTSIQKSNTLNINSFTNVEKSPSGSKGSAQDEKLLNQVIRTSSTEVSKTNTNKHIKKNKLWPFKRSKIETDLEQINTSKGAPKEKTILRGKVTHASIKRKNRLETIQKASENEIIDSMDENEQCYLRNPPNIKRKYSHLHKNKFCGQDDFLRRHIEARNHAQKLIAMKSNLFNTGDSRRNANIEELKQNNITREKWHKQLVTEVVRVSPMIYKTAEQENKQKKMQNRASKLLQERRS